MSNARPSRATVATPLLTGVALLAVGVLMLLAAPPVCPPFAATTIPAPCSPNWQVIAGSALVIVGGLLMLWLLLSTIWPRRHNR